MTMNRRDVLKVLGAAGLSAHLPAAVWAQGASLPDLAVITGPSPAENARAAVAALGGMGRFVSKGDKVVIKPNMGFGNPPARATTTEPQVVRALAELALEAGAKRVLVLDNPCHKADIVLEVCGIKKELAGLDDTFVYTVRLGRMFRKVEVPKGKSLKKTQIAVDILEADTIINVPIAKSHGSARVTFGMKAWMGVIKSRKPWHVWLNLSQCIADIATIIKPKLTVLDATRALVTGGPGGPGQIAHLKTVVAGVDPVAVDAYGVTMAPWGGKGYTVDQVPHIVAAAQHGVGVMDISRLNILRKNA